MVEPMTAHEANAYIPQWGSHMNDRDPGYIAYSAIPPIEAAHRDELVGYLRDTCLPIAEPDDVAELGRAITYLEGLEYE